MKKISIFTDGGSRGNPGPSAYGFVVKEGNEILHEEGRTIGVNTNNVAEYTAVLKSYEWLFDNLDQIGEIESITSFMDSLLLCQQLRGVFKIKKAHLQGIMYKIRETEHKLPVKVEYVHIPRELNKEADKLVNIALDSNL